MSKFVKNILIIISSTFLVASLFALGVLWIFSNNLPDYKFLKNYKPPVSSKVYSGEGELVSDFSSEKRIFVPYDAIPKKIVNSLLSAINNLQIDHNNITLNNSQNISNNLVDYSEDIDIIDENDDENDNNDDNEYELMD